MGPLEILAPAGACSLRSHGFSLHSKTDSGKSGFLITHTQTLENFIIRYLTGLGGSPLSIATPSYPLVIIKLKAKLSST